MKGTMEVAVCSRDRLRCTVDEKVVLELTLHRPFKAQGMVIVPSVPGAPDKGGSDTALLSALQKEGWATLAVRLLTLEEEVLDLRAHHLRYNIEVLSRRLAQATDWALEHTQAGELPVSFWGTGTGAAAALAAADQRPHLVSSIVSFDGRPDLADDALARLGLPLLFIVDESDLRLRDIHRDALRRSPATAKLTVVQGRNGRGRDRSRVLREVATLSTEWFLRHQNSAASMVAVS